jgi:hypothetical protein
VSVFRPRARRWPALVAVGIAALIVGAVLGYALRGGDSFADQAAGVRDRAQRIEAEVGVLKTEYTQGVDRAGRIVGRTEYDGSVRRVGEALQALDDHGADLRALDSRAYDQVRRTLRRLQQAVAGRRLPAEVLALVDESRAALADLTGS